MWNENLQARQDMYEFLNIQNNLLRFCELVRPFSERCVLLIQHRTWSLFSSDSKG